LHAVSVGEIAAAIPLVRALQSRLTPTAFYVSTSTIAGREAAMRQLSRDVDGIFYCPLDYPGPITRALRSIRPSLLIVLETEIWPNLYYLAHTSGAAVVIANARISDKTWTRYLRSKWLFGPVLQLARAIHAQSVTDRERYLALGVDPGKVFTAPNLKYDAAQVRPSVNLRSADSTQIWIAASTTGPNEPGSLSHHEIDEDDIVISAFIALAEEFPDLLLVIAPRQPARFETVARKLETSAVRFIRRSGMSSGASPVQTPAVILLDTMGELSGLYASADVVFVGGSIAPRGGHNIIEPASAGVAVVVGPHMENFQTIAADFLRAGALVQVSDGDELKQTVRGLLNDDEHRRAIGGLARRIVEGNRGVAQLLARDFADRYYSASPRRLTGCVAALILDTLGSLWVAGGCVKRRHGERLADSRPPLPCPVISIGGITVGGSGKTPFTNYLAGGLAARGYCPGILTRGYKRRSSAKHVVLARGAHLPSSFTGDEAQIFLRAGKASVGIGTNRYTTAQLLLRELPNTDVLLLDDAYQHAPMKRDFDVVVIDGLDPFGGEAVIPAGRLREPLDALKRADAFVITRAERQQRFDAIRARLAEFNPRAPAFRTRLAGLCWRDFATGACLMQMQHSRVGAFCGLGNPANFWRTLEALNLEIVFRWEFPDHHAYKPFELEYVAWQTRLHGASILVTTEKDRMNFPHQMHKVLAQAEVAWLEIQLELENDAGFFALLETTLRSRRAA
jgi:tetraacyldisaccharide 4'-kinase